MKFVWIMGADSLATFHRWRGWTQIMREVPVAVVSRPWISLKSRSHPPPCGSLAIAGRASRAQGLAGSKPPAWVFLYGRFNFMSSTALRARQAKVAAGFAARRALKD